MEPIQWAAFAAATLAIGQLFRLEAREALKGSEDGDE